MAKSKLKVVLPDEKLSEIQKQLASLFKEKATGVHFWVRAKPGSSKESLTLKEKKLHLTLRAPPVDGKANLAIIAALSKLFNTSKSKIHIHTGEKSREKEICISNTSIKNCIESLILYAYSQH